MLENLFNLEDNNTTVRREFLAGLTTFMTMAYIIFVNPSILGTTGMDPGAVMVATILATTIATVVMGLYANYPFALAPGMGLNAYFAFTVVGQMGLSWQVALGTVFISGLIFIVLTLTRFRQLIINEAIPVALKASVGAGIGLFIALIGVKNAGLVIPLEPTLVALGDVLSARTVVSIVGLLVIAALMARKVNGAILWGILATAGLGLVSGVVEVPAAVVSLPPSLAPTFLALDIPGALSLGALSVIFAFLFVDFFDTAGTLVGVASHANFLNDKGELPRAERALMADAVGTTAGSMLGTSTVTTYIESATGVALGGRTGLTALVTGGLFLVALFFSPIVTIIAAEPAITAPALIIVGSLMLRGIVSVEWGDPSESIPAFLTAVMMPFTFSIANGIAVGFVSYAAIKLLAGRGKEVHWLTYVLAGLFVLRFIYLQG